MNPLEEKERALWRQQKHLEFKDELRKNEKFMQFLERTDPRWRESFIDEYAFQKVNWIEWGAKHIEWLEREDLQWVEDATGRLKEIQQKKLFDIQCLWRAEKITLPQIKLTDDFSYWEKNILNCPFIEPVTESEVDMYIQYLQSENFEKSQGWLDRWQDYEEIKEAYNSENADRNFPDWYDFHNGRTGLSAYLLLPDIRGKKEEFYMDLWRNELHEKVEKQKQQPAPTPAPDSNLDQRPFLDYHKKGWMTWFINTFEDKQTQETFKRFGGENPYRDYDEYLQDDLRMLEHADRIVPIQGWFDWKEALHKTAFRYFREKVTEALPLAYEQYQMRVEMGLAFEVDPDLPVYDKWYHDALLRGRELNGEPRDYDF